MRTPTEFELQQLLHVAAEYDPVKAHEYYEKHKKLKGRRKGRGDVLTKRAPSKGLPAPRVGRALAQIQKDARTKQRKELMQSIQALEKKLQDLEARIKKLAHEEASEDRKGQAKKERAAKEAAKPDTAAEKAEAARESKKYRDEHKQELKTKSKESSDKTGSAKEKSEAKAKEVSGLKTLATKVKGQIAVAKQKLAAL